jgi:hypothetical protein
VCEHFTPFLAAQEGHKKSKEKQNEEKKEKKRMKKRKRDSGTFLTELPRHCIHTTTLFIITSRTLDYIHSAILYYAAFH